MNCERFKEYLENYENLDDEQKAEMNTHAAECEECRSELEFFLSIIETTKSLPKIEPPADFMDKLNIRIDGEERIKRNAARRIIRNMRHNWKQYAAAAACFALVAVVTANGRMFVDKMNGSDDGVITENTVKDGDNISDDVPVIMPDSDVADSQAAGEKIDEVNNQTTDNVNNTDGAAVEKKTKLASNSNSNKAASVSAEPTEPSETAKTSNSANTSSEEAAAAASVKAAETASNESLPNENAAQQDTEDNYDTAPSSMTYGANDKSRSADQKNAVNGYSIDDEDGVIAYGTYYRIDKDGNPIDEAKEPKAIGKLKISSDDADKALNVINQYPHGEDGDLYTIDSASMTLILSSLRTQGINYTNYTLAGDGNIKFRIVFE